MTLAQVRRFAMSLPDVTGEPHFNYCSFRVRVVGLRVTLANAKPGVVTTLLAAAWSRKAPKSLHATMAARAVRGKMPGT